MSVAALLYDCQTGAVPPPADPAASRTPTETVVPLLAAAVSTWGTTGPGGTELTAAAPLFLAAAILVAALPPLRSVRDVPLETR